MNTIGRTATDAPCAVHIAIGVNVLNMTTKAREKPTTKTTIASN
jgi:hypothetical protein